MRKIIYKILVFLGLIKEENEIELTKKEETIYAKKPLMTEYEYRFYQILKLHLIVI